MAHDPVPPCPDDLALAAFVHGPVPEGEQRVQEGHLSACDLCRARASELALAMDEDAAGEADPATADPVDGVAVLRRGIVQAGWPHAAMATRRPVSAWKRGAVAAAVLACAAGGLYFFSGPGGRLDPALENAPIPLGKPVSGVSGTLRTATASELFSLPDGTRLRIGPCTALAFHAPRSGERVHIAMEEGTLEVLTDKGKGSLRISAQAGEIEVLGTHFTVRAFELDGKGALEGFKGGPVLAALVHEGKVALRNTHGTVVLGARRRGIAFADSAPIEQEQAGTREEGLRHFKECVEWTGSGWRIRPGREDFCRLAAATLWGSGWGGEAVGDPGIPRPLLDLFKRSEESR